MNGRNIILTRVYCKYNRIDLMNLVRKSTKIFQVRADSSDHAEIRLHSDILTQLAEIIALKGLLVGFFHAVARSKAENFPGLFMVEVV